MLEVKGETKTVNDVKSVCRAICGLRPSASKSIARSDFEVGEWLIDVGADKKYWSIMMSLAHVFDVAAAVKFQESEKTNVKFQESAKTKVELLTRSVGDACLLFGGLPCKLRELVNMFSIHSDSA